MCRLVPLLKQVDSQVLTPCHQQQAPLLRHQVHRLEAPGSLLHPLQPRLRPRQHWEHLLASMRPHLLESLLELENLRLVVCLPALQDRRLHGSLLVVEALRSQLRLAERQAAREGSLRRLVLQDPQLGHLFRRPAVERCLILPPLLAEVVLRGL
jgi:hypothetical protein